MPARSRNSPDPELDGGDIGVIVRGLIPLGGLAPTPVSTITGRIIASGRDEVLKLRVSG